MQHPYTVVKDYQLNITAQKGDYVFITKSKNRKYINSDYCIHVNDDDFSFFVARGVYDAKNRKLLSPQMIGTGTGSSFSDAIHKGIEIILRRD